MPKPQRAEAKIATPRPARKTRAATSAVGAWGEREAGILAVAEDLFLRNGYENTSMAAVAAAAGLSEGTLYNYFRNKNDLVIRSGLAVLERRVEAAQQAVREAGSLREGLERLIALHLSAIIEDDVSILHSVTLGGTGKSSGDRHPKIRRGVLLAAGAKILGNIEVGCCAKVGAGSVVLDDVPANTTVAGVPARVVSTHADHEPARDMDQSFD